MLHASDEISISKNGLGNLKKPQEVGTGQYNRVFSTTEVHCIMFNYIKNTTFYVGFYEENRRGAENGSFVKFLKILKNIFCYLYLKIVG